MKNKKFNTVRNVPNYRKKITEIETKLIFLARMSLVEQELPALPEHLSSHPVFSRIRVIRSLVLCVCFVDRGLSFCTFFFVIVLSVLLRNTDSDYPIDIFKLLFIHGRSHSWLGTDTSIKCGVDYASSIRSTVH
jgi:hypothetical protein